MTYPENKFPSGLDLVEAEDLTGNALFVIQNSDQAILKSMKMNDFVNKFSSYSQDITEKLSGDGFFGDGSDGDKTLTEDLILTKPTYWENLTIPVGITFYPNGFDWSVHNILQLDGIIDYSGNDGSNGGNASGFIGGDKGSGALPQTQNHLPAGIGSPDGGIGYKLVYGSSPDGFPGSATINALINATLAGKKGGGGGNAPGGNSPTPAGLGGAKGAVTLLNTKLDLISLILGRVFTDSGVVTFNINGSNGASGAGGAGADALGGGNFGGGGGGASPGGNAGMLSIFAKIIRGSGTVKCNGGKGGKGGRGGSPTVNPRYGSGAGAAGAGADGGNAGFIFIYSFDMSGFTGFIFAVGGKGGDGNVAGNGGDAVEQSSFYVGEAGDGGDCSDAGDGGAGGLVIIMTETTIILFTVNVNYGDGGDAGSSIIDSSGGVYISTDSGLTWTKESTGIDNTLVNATCACGINLFAGAGTHIYKSQNNGVSWTEVGVGQITGIINCLFTNGTDVWTGTSLGLYLSQDGGATWMVKNSGRTYHQVASIAVLGTTLFVSSNSIPYQSTDNGGTWSTVSTLTNVGCDVVYASGSNLWISGQGSFPTYSGIWLSTDSGLTWTQKSTGLSSPNINSFAVIGSNVFAGDKYAGVYLSIDNGDHWNLVNTGLSDTGIQCLTSWGTKLYAGTQSGVFLTTNNGTIWTAENTGLTTTNVHSILFILSISVGTICENLSLNS